VARPAPPKTRIDIYLPGADADVRRIVQEIVEVEAPIAVDLLTRRVRDAWGIGRAGSRVADAVRRQLDWLRSRGRVRVDDGFAWVAGRELQLVRLPGDDPATIREVEHVTAAELRECIAWLAEHTAPGPRSQLLREVARLFGWRRLGPDIARTLDAHVDELVREGRLVVASDQVRSAGGAAVRPGAELEVAPEPQPPRAPEPAPVLPADLDRCMTERGWRRRSAELKRLEARLEEARREGDTPRAARLSTDLSRLRMRLDEAVVVATPGDAGRATLGCRVEFRDNDGAAESWLLVPPAEADATDGRLDVSTPYGLALYGRQTGDRVELDADDGRHVIELLAIEVD
jgi:transcription elongation GreA/GreB family factor